MHKFKTLFLISKRYTFSKSGDTFVSFIAKTSMWGMTLGIAVLIVVLSVMNGFASELHERILGALPHATLRVYGSPIEDWQTKIKQIEADFPETVQTVTPLTDVDVLLNGPSGNASYLQLMGVEPSLEKNASNFSQHIVRGNFDDLDTLDFGIILGEITARRLGADVGDSITVILPSLEGGITGFYPIIKSFQIVAVFNTRSQIDLTHALIHRRDATKLLRIPKTSTEGLKISFYNFMQAPELSAKIAQKLDESYMISNWTSHYGNLFQAIRMEKQLIGLLLLLVIMVAAFNIMSTLVMIGKEKINEIAILRTLGAYPKDILFIFLLQGMTIGTIGICLGTLIGVPLAYYIGDIIHFIEQLLSLQFLSSDTYFITYLPSKIKLSDIIWINTLGFLLCISATLYPALRAMRLDPARILRTSH